MAMFEPQILSFEKSMMSNPWPTKEPVAEEHVPQEGTEELGKPAMFTAAAAAGLCMMASLFTKEMQ